MILAAGGDALLLLELGGVVLLLGLLARLAAALELSPVPFYLAAGIALGAVADGPLSFSTEVVEVGAQVGLVLLLFTLGLEHSPRELGAGLARNARAGALDLVLGLLPGLAAGVLLGWSAEASLVLGGVTYISSSGIVVKVIGDLGRGEHPETRTVVSILVLEDLAMAVYLPVLGIVLAGTAFLPGVGIIAAALLALLLAVRIAVHRGHVLSGALASRSDEALLLLALGVGLVAAGAAEAIALSAPVGAFLAGLALAEPVAARARALLLPLRDVLAAVFFILFAQQIELGELPAVAPAAVALAVVALAAKVATVWWGRPDLPADARVRAGTALGARGEFSIIIAGLGVAAGVEPQLGALAAGFVLLTAFGAPLLTRLVDRERPVAPTRQADDADVVQDPVQGRKRWRDPA